MSDTSVLVEDGQVFLSKEELDEYREWKINQEQEQ